MDLETKFKKETGLRPKVPRDYYVKWLEEQLTIAKFFKPQLIWDWYDFGLMLRINKQHNIGNYYFAIDMQILWLNIWVQCWKKH